MMDFMPKIERIDDEKYKQMILEAVGFDEEEPINAEFFTKNDVLFVRYKEKELSFVEFWDELKHESPKLGNLAYDSIKKLSERNGFSSVDQFLKEFAGKDEMRVDLSVSTDGKIIFRPEVAATKEQ